MAVPRAGIGAARISIRCNENKGIGPAGGAESGTDRPRTPPRPGGRYASPLMIFTVLMAVSHFSGLSTRRVVGSMFPSKWTTRDLRPVAP